MASTTGKHTEGPWGIFASQPILITDKNSREIAYVPVCLMDCDEPQALADARLIAAAPELLDALSDCCVVLESIRFQLLQAGKKSEAVEIVLGKSRAAVAKTFPH